MIKGMLLVVGLAVFIVFTTSKCFISQDTVKVMIQSSQGGGQ